MQQGELSDSRCCLIAPYRPRYRPERLAPSCFTPCPGSGSGNAPGGRERDRKQASRRNAGPAERDQSLSARPLRLTLFGTAIFSLGQRMSARVRRLRIRKETGRYRPPAAVAGEVALGRKQRTGATVSLAVVVRTRTVQVSMESSGFDQRGDGDQAMTCPRRPVQFRCWPTRVSGGANTVRGGRANWRFLSRICAAVDRSCLSLGRIGRRIRLGGL